MFIENQCQSYGIKNSRQLFKTRPVSYATVISSALYVRGHCSHDVCPTVSLYVPLVHWSHAVCPTVSLYLPLAKNHVKNDADLPQDGPLINLPSARSTRNNTLERSFLVDYTTQRHSQVKCQSPNRDIVRLVGIFPKLYIYYTFLTCPESILLLLGLVPSIHPVLTSPSSTFECISIGHSSNRRPETVWLQVRHQCVCLRLKSLDIFNKSTQTRMKTPTVAEMCMYVLLPRTRQPIATPQNRLATMENNHDTHMRGPKPKKGHQCFFAMGIACL